jgi:hypothetical protein
MNNDDARDALNDLLTRAIDCLPIEEFAIDIATAQAMLDTLPNGSLRDALTDAFRDNIDCDDDTIILT